MPLKWLGAVPYHTRMQWTPLPSPTDSALLTPLEHEARELIRGQHVFPPLTAEQLLQPVECYVHPEREGCVLIICTGCDHVMFNGTLEGWTRKLERCLFLCAPLRCTHCLTWRRTMGPKSPFD